MKRIKQMLFNYGSVLIEICLRDDPENVYDSKVFISEQEADEFAQYYINLGEYVYIRPPK